VAQQQPPGFGQLNGPRAAGALDQPRPDEALERRDLLADGRLRVPQRRRGPAERAVLGNRLQRRKVTQLDSQPSIRFRNGKYL
jgi:hypothetical protein